MRRSATAALALLLAVGLSACGDDDGGGSGNGGGNGGGADADLTVIGLDIEFDQASYTAPAGPVAVLYENEGSLNHTLLIEGIDDFKLSVATRGDTDEGTVELEPGDYVIYCDVSGHRSAGMEADLTVE